MGRTRNDKVWKYFNRISSYRAQCTLCKVQITCKTTSSNLVRHLYTRHRLDASHAGASHYAFLRYIDKSLRTPRIVARDNDGNDDDTADKVTSSPTKDGGGGFLDPVEFIVKNEAAETAPTLLENNLVPTLPEEHHNSNSDTELHKQQECHDAEDEDFPTLHPLSEFQITSIEPPSSPCMRSGNTSAQNCAGESTALRAKLQAETRYFNELAALARAKRIMVELQNKKLRFELDNLLATKWKT